jgi:hypothetical protein
MDLSHAIKARIRRHPTLNHWALKAYAVRHPPPYRRPNMEFDFDAWMSISSLRYRGGRQIGEDNAGPHPYQENAQNEYETCRFADSRRGLQMNVTNLRMVMPYAKDAYQLTTALRNRYIARRGLDSRRLTLVQAYLFSKFAISLPAYLTRRRDRPVPDGQLEPLETAFYMLGTAPFMLVRQMMVRGDTGCLDPTPMTGRRLYELADASGVLISTRSRACPASIKLICEFYDVIMNGTYEGPLDSPDVGRALDLLGDWDRFYEYVHASSRIELLVKLAQACTAASLLELKRTAVPGSADDALLASALACALQRSYVKTSGSRDEAAVLGSIRDVVVAVLRDHGDDETLHALKSIGYLSAASDSADGARPVTARRIREGTHVVLDACRREIQTVQRALGRSGWRPLQEHDLLQRAGGPELSALLERMGA